jgi:hypothetical protein
MAELTDLHHLCSLEKLGVALELMMYLWPTQEKLFAVVLVQPDTCAVGCSGDCMETHPRAACDGGDGAAQGCTYGIGPGLLWNSVLITWASGSPLYRDGYHDHEPTRSGRKTLLRFSQNLACSTSKFREWRAEIYVRMWTIAYRSMLSFPSPAGVDDEARRRRIR